MEAEQLRTLGPPPQARRCCRCQVLLSAPILEVHSRALRSRISVKGRTTASLWKARAILDVAVAVQPFLRLATEGSDCPVQLSHDARTLTVQARKMQLDGTVCSSNQGRRSADHSRPARAEIAEEQGGRRKDGRVGGAYERARGRHKRR